MSQPAYRVRRATLEDIGALTTLWQSMDFAVEDLAPRITEFQVAETADGALLGALALQIAGRHGRIHSEAFTDFALADHLRPLLWDRLQVVAANYGLARLWTQEQAPFWNHCGMVPADGEALAKLPAAWQTGSTRWMTLKLKAEVEEVLSLDQDFALYMRAEKQRSERILEHARVLKFLATVIAAILFIAVLLGAFFLVRQNPQLLHR